METESTNSKRGRPRKYPVEQQKDYYKKKQTERYSIVKEEKCQKTKHQGQVYRHAFKLLKELWDDKLILDTKYTTSIQALVEQKQIIE